MVSPQIHAPKAPRLAWIVGGSLLLTTVLLSAAPQILARLDVGADIALPVVFAAALLIFAYGLRGSGSVTNRRPLGTVALTVLAAWVLLTAAITSVLAFGISSDVPPPTLLEFSNVSAFVQFGLALIAVIQIARAHVLPAPWNWAPAWVLAAMTASWLLTQIIAAGATQETATTLAFGLGSLAGLIHAGSAMFLGVLAIVLGDRSNRTQDVPVSVEAK